MREGYCPTQDCDLYYQIHGEGEPIVFLHGFSLDHRMWEEQIDFFKTKFQVIVYDCRGFGRSDKPIGSYSHVEDLESIIRYFNLAKFHLVGLSMGGGVALDFTLKNSYLVKSLS